MGNTNRAPKGRGSVMPAKRRDGSVIPNRWRIRDSWTDAAGNQHKVNETFNGSKSRAWKRLEEMRNARDQGLDMEGSKLTFGEFANDWQAAREESGELAPKTLIESGRHVRVLNGYIGAYRLCDLQAATVEKTLRDLRRDRAGKDGGHIGGRTLQAYYQTLKLILDRACDYDYILRNPCAKVKPPRAAEPERRALSSQDASRLLARLEEEQERERAAFDEKERRQADWHADSGRKSLRGLHGMSYLVCVRIGLMTGVRLGEALALTWGAIDLDAGCIHVLQSIGHDGKPKPPKTKAGKRTIWLDRSTVDHLATWKHEQREQLVKLGIVRRGGNTPDRIPVVCSDTGGFSDANNFGAWWRKWRTENGFPGLKYHELRHTQATQLLAAGVDVKTVQTRLGHADPALTLKWYAHPIAENDMRAAETLGNMLAS